MEARRQEVVKELEEKQRALSKQADNFDERTKELAKVLDQVKAGICHWCCMKPAFMTITQFTRIVEK